MASHGIYGPLGDKLVAVEPPTWARLLAARLKARGHPTTLLDGELLRWSAGRIAQEVEILDPDLVVLAVYGHMPSAATQQMFGAREVALALRALNPSRRIAILGGHVSALPARTLGEEPVDYAVQGEGPLTIEALLDGDPLVIVPGLVWRDQYLAETSIVVNPAARALDPDADLGAQGWEFTPPDAYTCHNWQALGYPAAARRPYASVITSFNCPYNCSFCQISTPFGGSGYKTRSPKGVVDEIEMLVRDYGVHFIKVVDEMFILKPSHYLPIAEGLAERGLGEKVNIWCYGRVDSIKPETLATLRRGGFRWIALGIESGSAHVRDGADKRLRTSDIVGIVRQVQDAGLSVVGNFMFGLRDDDHISMQQTLDLALECLPEWANFYCTMALPGSKLYDQALAEGWALPTEWRGYSQHNEYCYPLATEHLTSAEVLAFRDAAFQRYFTDPHFLARTAAKFGPAAADHVREMTRYKLRRNLLEPA